MAERLVVRRQLVRVEGSVTRQSTFDSIIGEEPLEIR